ncbi:hypothetical protein PTSG_11959 [Salpingoeca rosetta]|uniref:EGF-like domain-containing protein n=1 Tax=Salpingoeca rosetta (strain ATCC 50818 / BSB-021) TaxID=946362 RepID=F2U437_SALR5|nr:uncharacterized protein PTSG_11959 [Salpingoeca rosetta]EGD82403.1 hypothetical protein PTSG_11959 [Salpingoeca rosetta]|eukprot:XP_004995639.1 hypothetical protein PTSG_11959 [Salpingoeca rosetta]
MRGGVVRVALTLVLLLVVLSMPSSGQANVQQTPTQQGPSRVPDLRKYNQPTKQGRRVYDHFVVKGAGGQHTELRYDMTYAEDVVPLSDFVDEHAAFQVTTVLCTSESIVLGVSDIEAARNFIAPERVLFPGESFKCSGPSNEHTAAYVEEVAVSEGKLVLSVEWEHFMTAFDEIDIELHHRPEGHANSSMAQGSGPRAPRMRRETVQGCTCTDDCGVDVDIGLFDQDISSWCHTADNCADGRDYCTAELSANADVVSWNYAGGGNAEQASYELYSEGGVTISCEDCYATLNAGVTFRFHATGGLSVDLMELTATATAAAQATLQAQFQAQASFEFETPPLLGENGVPGPTFIIPVITIPLQTSINFRAMLEMQATATVTVSAGISYERSITGGVAYTDGDFSGIREVGGSGLETHGPTFDAGVHATAVLRLIPQIRLFITEALPLSLTVSLQPYVGAEGDINLQKLVAEAFWGLDLGLATEAIEFGPLTIVDAWEDAFALIERKTIGTFRREFNRRRDYAFEDTPRVLIEECNFECPSNSTCISENGVAACYCDQGFEAHRDIQEADECRPTEESELCAQVDCHLIPNAECRRGMCFCRDGYVADIRNRQPVCTRADGLSPEDPCANVTCGAHSTCTAGQCVCNDGFHLEEYEDGFDCVPTDPCNGVVCGLSAFCIRGMCHCAVGFILSDDGFNCAPHLPECGSMTDEIMDRSTCYPGATCQEDSQFPDRQHCVCDDDRELRFYEDGTVACEAPNLCSQFPCPPGHVCKLQPVTRQPACVRVAEPCKVGNGGCGVNAHCVRDEDEAGWSCECNQGHYGNPFRECVLRNPCQVDASGGCSIHADCSVDENNERMCMCKEGYTGDGYTCKFSACERDDAPVCHEKGMCVAANQRGQAKCVCKSGYFGNGTHCFSADPCAENGPCDPSSSICIIDNEQPMCACAPGHVLSENGTACVEAPACNAAAFSLKCSTNADCVVVNETASCRCKAGYRDVGRESDPEGYRCQRVDPCVEHSDDLCPGDYMVCANNKPGRYRCRCQPGFELTNDYECAEINPCESGHRSGCDKDAVCNHTGPGTHTCTCLDGFTGDGFTCTPLNPCEDGASPCEAETEVCQYLGPNRHRCVCQDGYARDEETGMCAPRNMCAVLQGGCPANSYCHMDAVNAFSCVCEFGFYPTGTSLFQTGIRALSSCQSARVDIVTTRRGLTATEASALVRDALQQFPEARGVVLANVTAEETDAIRGLFRTTIVVEHMDTQQGEPVALRPMLVADALNATFIAEDGTRAAVDPQEMRTSPVFQGAFVAYFSPYSAQSIDAVRFEAATQSSANGLSGGAIAGAVIGSVFAVAIVAAVTIAVVRRGGLRKVDVFSHGPRTTTTSSDV